jgi:RNA polymerase sigma-70 factor (ECF subfamily)
VRSTAGRTSNQALAEVSALRAGCPYRDRSGGTVRDEQQDRGQVTVGVLGGRGEEFGAERATVVDELARTDREALYRRALRLTRDHDAAQDLVQDTLERAYRKLAHYRPGTSMPAWIACLMRNVWISSYRRRAGDPPLVPLDKIGDGAPYRHPSYASASSDVEASVVDELSVALIRLAIEGLPSHLRQVVILADVEETPYSGIAAALAIPTGTVASRLSRGRRRLQHVLLDQAHGGGLLARAG